MVALRFSDFRLPELLEVVLRKNEFAVRNFGIATLAGNPKALGTAKSLNVRGLKLACVPTVDGLRPNTWDYLFDVRLDQMILELTIRQNSTALRSSVPGASSKLGPEEELLLVAPVGTMKLVLNPDSPEASTRIEARILLRDFPELRNSR